MKKYASLLLIPSVMLSISSAPAMADEDTVKSVLGGMLGSMIVEGVKEMNTQEPEQQTPPQQQIIWTDQKAEQKDVRAKKPKSLETILTPEVLKERTRNEEIQTALKKLGFYPGPIDGIAGETMSVGIFAWESEFGSSINDFIDYDGNVTDPELKFMNELADKGFNDRYEHELATAEGFTNRNDYKTQKIKESNEFLQDAEAFLKTYDGDIDLKRITSDLKEMQQTKRGHWEASLQSSLDNLRHYFYTIDGFTAFQEEQQKQRLIAGEQRKDKMKKEIEDIQSFAKEYLKNNITNDQAIDLAEALQNDEATEGVPIEEIDIEKSLGFKKMHLTDSGLTNEFFKWKKQQDESRLSQKSSERPSTDADITDSNPKPKETQSQSWIPSFTSWIGK